jgi:hypothetical protein
VRNCIVYPFLYNATFSKGYAWTLELARKTNRSIKLFSVISQQREGKEKEACYYAYLKAHSDYAQQFLAKHQTVPQVRLSQVCIPTQAISPHFTLAEQLVKQIEHQPGVLVVLQPELFSYEEQQHIIQSSPSAIVLPEAIEQTPEDIPAKKFYDIFLRSRHFKVPDTFIHDLSGDTSLFNHLTSFFGRRCG